MGQFESLTGILLDQEHSGPRGVKRPTCSALTVCWKMKKQALGLVLLVVHDAGHRNHALADC